MRTPTSFSAVASVHRLIAVAICVATGADATGVAGAGPRPADDCNVLPRPAMRLRLTLNSPQLAEAAPAIREVATATWAREGVDLQWVDDPPGGPLTWTGIDLWVMVRPEAASHDNPEALGAVLFAGGAPQPLIRVSTDAVVEWVHREVATRFQTSERPFPALTLGNTRALVTQAVGYAVAHEIGHYVLASRAHARDGLMAAAYLHPRALSADATLDARNRARLIDRLTLGASCPARLVFDARRPQ